VEAGLTLKDNGYLVRVVRLADGRIVARELVEHKEAKRDA